MPLRAIHHHLERLETVTIFCSEKSFSQVTAFLNICDDYPEVTKIRGAHPEEKRRQFLLILPSRDKAELTDAREAASLQELSHWDFENFAQLFQAFSDLFEEFGNRNFYDKDVMIDLTGGQKPNSVVAALMTFNRKIKAQYVQTNYPWKVVSYDISLLFPDRGGF